MSAVFLALVVASGACGGSSKRATQPAGAAPAGRIMLEGNALVPASELLAEMHSDTPLSAEGDQRPSDDDLARAQLLLAAAYYDRGFLEVQISNPSIERAADGRFLNVRIRIQEGQRFRIGTLTIEERDESGKTVVPLGAMRLRDWIALEDGEVFARNVLVRDLEAIKRLYRDAGYADVDIDVQTTLDRPNAIVDVALPLRRNQLTTIDRVVVVGNKSVMTDVIKRTIGIPDGAPFGETKLDEAKGRLLALDLFSIVDVASHETHDKSRVTITFEVAEK